MIAHAQAHWSNYTDIDQSETEENDSVYDNIEPVRAVGTDPNVTNALSTLLMYDTGTELPELVQQEKPTELHALRELLEIMQHRIDIIPNSEWKPRFPST